MAHSDYCQLDEYKNRLKKRQEILDRHIDPYPHKFTPTHTAAQLIAHYENHSLGSFEDASQGKGTTVILAGRLVLFRGMGKNTFAHIQDQTGRIQVLFNRESTQWQGAQGTLEMKELEKLLDLGDWVGVQGELFRTQKGEITLFVRKVVVLSKALLPLPDKHSGLHDKELRYRKRWLDLISNRDVRETFEARSRILVLLREFFQRLNFLEVETPVLQSVYGGADAAPFKTELHALHQEMFLRISLEIPLKKLLVGGMERVFEIGKVFRNEGLDRTHNPEFTMLEAYASCWDYEDLMVCVENLFEYLAKELYGTTKIPALHPKDGTPIEIDLKAPWKRMTMAGSLQKYADLNFEEMTDEECREKLLETEEYAPAELAEMTRGMLLVELFESFVEQHLVQPHHIFDHPIETTPLCKPHRAEEQKKKGIIERFESFILGSEMCNAYSELNDPVLQRDLMLAQAEKRLAGEEGDKGEIPPVDEEFLEAVAQGMPPAGGLGIGVDRLVMLLTQAHSIRDVLFFPMMKPQNE